jgi:hypothetical protein
MATTKKAPAAVQWSAIETSPGSWEAQHSGGRRFTEDEARVAVDAVNSLRSLRVRIKQDCMVAGEVKVAGTMLDLPVRLAQDLCSNASVAELVPEEE